MSLLPVDLTGIILSELQQERDDGLLHASSHLVAPMRHVQLELAGAPRNVRTFGDAMTLQIGTLVHEWLEGVLRNLGLPFMGEVNLTPWLPKGWGGTADIVMWNPELKQFVLTDLKTTKGESLKWREERGASDEHRWQASMYWHGLRKMGVPIARKIGIFYLPKNDVQSRVVEPVMIEFDPIPAKQIAAEASRRRKSVDEYRKSLPKPNPRPLLPEEFLTEALAPVPERVQKVRRVKGEHVLKLEPHWTARFCPFPNELCNCNEHGTNVLGYFDNDGDFWPREGYEDVEPEVWPEEE